MEQTILDMLYLCGCVLNHTQPDWDRVSKMNIPKLFVECRNQSLGAMVYGLLRQWPGFANLTEEQRLAWKKVWMQSLQKSILLKAERGEICDWLEENGIWYMPLKGSVLQDFYPELGMREMSDNDILIDPTARQEIHDYMVNTRGYTVYEYSPIESYDDVYQKQPVYIFEMHKRLFEEDTPVHEAYYADVASRLLPVPGKTYARRFSDEDFYLYLLAHAHRHFEASGTGLRLLVDCYVWAHAKALDWTYLEEELKKLELYDFGRTCHSLAEKLLGGQKVPLNQEEKKMLDYMVQCGTFGTEEIRAENRVRRQMERMHVDAGTAKRQLILRRLFPDLHYYELRAPIVYRYRILIPFYWLWRLLRGILQGGFVQELRQLHGAARDEEKRT